VTQRLIHLGTLFGHSDRLCDKKNQVHALFTNRLVFGSSHFGPPHRNRFVRFCNDCHFRSISRRRWLFNASTRPQKLGMKSRHSSRFALENVESSTDTRHWRMLSHPQTPDLSTVSQGGGYSLIQVQCVCTSCSPLTLTSLAYILNSVSYNPLMSVCDITGSLSARRDQGELEDGPQGSQELRLSVRGCGDFQTHKEKMVS